MRKIALMLAILMAFGACFVSCGKDDKKENEGTGSAVGANKTEFMIFEGDYQSLTGSELKSSDTSVVEVVRDGLVRACKPGTAKITAKNEGKSITYTVTVIDLSVVTLGTDYKEVSEAKFKEVFDAEIAEIMSNFAQYTEVTDRTDVRDGDKVNINYVGKMNGKEFEGGTGTYDLVIGSNSFIDGFEDGLIGEELGTTVDLDLTFPDPYSNNPDFAGKPVVFTVTINKISAPEAYSDELVKKATGYATIEEYEAHLKMLVATDLMFTKLADESKVSSIPEDVKQYYYDGYVQDMIDYLAAYGMTVTTKEEIISTMGYTQASFDEMVWSSVNAQIEQDYVFYRYCKEYGIRLNDELYQKHLASFLELYECKDEADMLKTYSITLDTLYESFLYEMVMEHMYKDAVIVSDAE